MSQLIALKNDCISGFVSDSIKDITTIFLKAGGICVVQGSTMRICGMDESILWEYIINNPNESIFINGYTGEGFSYNQSKTTSNTKIGGF